MDPVVVTTPAAFANAAAGEENGVRVPVEFRVRVSDPFEAYRRARQGTGKAYLATTGGQSGWGYFGVDPIEIVSVGPETDSTLDRLSSVLAGERLQRGECAVPYPAGAIGWLSYDVARELESLPAHAERDRELPRLQLALYDRLAAWREPRGDGQVRLHITACPTVADPTDETSVQSAYQRGRERARQLVEQIDATSQPDSLSPPAADHDSTVQFESECGRDAFTERVERAKSYIRDGDTFQANISQRLRAPAAVHPVAAFDALREVNPAPYSALLEFPGVDLVSASPELLLERDGDTVVTEPIAGTRPRGDTEATDADLEADLRSDEKERAEHAMLVDLERNDLGKVSEFGTVEVTEYRRVDRYAEVMHLVSEIEGQLRDNADLGDAVGAVFPGGTITGAPKPRTMEIIDELEATRRGPYTGSIGLFGFDDRATLNIVIRTLVRYEEAYYLRVGAGIVHDSVPDREYDETLDKGRALITAINNALGDRIDLEVEA